MSVLLEATVSDLIICCKTTDDDRSFIQYGYAWSVFSDVLYAHLCRAKKETGQKQIKKMYDYDNFSFWNGVSEYVKRVLLMFPALINDLLTLLMKHLKTTLSVSWSRLSAINSRYRDVSLDETFALINIEVEFKIK